MLFAAPAVAGPLVDAAWVGAHACDDGVVVLDLRESERALERGRVPCSVHAPYTGLDWRVERDGVGGMLPAAQIITSRSSDASFTAPITSP